MRKLVFHDVDMPLHGLKPLCSYLENVDPSNLEELVLSSLDMGSNMEDLTSMLTKNTHLKRLKVIMGRNFF